MVLNTLIPLYINSFVLFSNVTNERFLHLTECTEKESGCFSARGIQTEVAITVYLVFSELSGFENSLCH